MAELQIAAVVTFVVAGLALFFFMVTRTRAAIAQAEARVSLEVSSANRERGN